MSRRGLKRWLRLPRRRRNIAAEVRLELENHLELSIEFLLARGFSPAEAVAEAKRRLGPVDDAAQKLYPVALERENAMNWRDWFKSFDVTAMELVASLRFLARRKAVALVAVLTMACALGVNTAALAVVRAFLFSSVGVPEPDRLVNIAPIRELPGRGDVVFLDGYRNYELIRESKRSFSHVAVTRQNIVSWSQGTDVRALQNTRASASFFATMRVPPMMGRGFTEEEEGPSPDPVIVISHALWNGAFGRDPAIIGKVLTIDGAPTTVIGVMPEGFSQPEPTDVWTPFDLPAQQRAVITGGRWVAIWGRIADGVSHETARAEVDDFTRRHHEASPADNKDYHYRMDTLRDQLLAGADSTVLLIQIAAASLLFLAVLNLVSLLVAWGFERNQEMAVRLALGGGQAQIVRLLLAQSALIVGAGLMVGIGLAHTLLVLARQLDLGPQLGFFVRQAAVNPAILAISLGVAMVVAILAGMLPVAVNNRLALSSALRSSSRSATHSAGALRLQRGMVVLQASLSVVVLAAATVVGVSFRNLAAIPDGFDARDRVVGRLILPDESHGTHAKRVAFASAVIDALSREAAVVRPALTTTLPVGDIRRGSRFLVPDQNGAITGEPVQFHFRRISPEYPVAMGMTLLRGRLLTARDDSVAPKVALVSRALAQRYWPNEDPIGKRILQDNTGNVPDVPFEIVGVVTDMMDGGYQALPGEAVYVPFAQVSSPPVSIVVTAKGGTAEAIAAIRRAVASADPMLAVSGTAPLSALVSTANALPQLRAALLLVFAVAAIMIAGLGSYGVMRQLVANREREFAVRLVFGATPSDLGREVLLQVTRLTIPGVVAGLIGAWFAARLLRAFVFGVDPRSVSVLLSVSAGVLLLATVSAIPSMLRAMRLDARGTAMS
jgi:putative ABC transport system permease protein